MYKEEEEYTESSVYTNARLYKIVLLFVFTTYIAFAIHTTDILLIRFLRIPVLIFLIMYTLRYSHNELFRMGKNIRFLRGVFMVFLLYMVFNVFTSLNYLNSVIYLLWLLGAFLFFFYVVKSVDKGAESSDIIYTISKGFFWPGLIFIIESLIGGYVLKLPSYFDEGLNFETGGAIKEFGGVFGNANTLAMVVFVTFSSLLIIYTYRTLLGYKALVYLFMLFFLLGLQIHVGSRTGIFCIYTTALLYILFYKRNVYYVLLLLLPTIVYLVLNFTIIEEIFQVRQFEENKYGNRTELIDDAFRIVDLMNSFGVGYANQRSAREFYAVTQQFKEGGELNFHNTYLALWVELGYIGLFLFIIPIFYIVVKSFFFVRTPNQRYTEQVRLLIVTVFPTALFGLAEDSINMAGSPVFAFFWLYFFLVVFLMDNTYQIHEKDSLF